jgi:hypothetical protein
MRKTPPNIEMDILARLLNGESYESVTDGRVSKSTVNRIVNTFQEKCSDFWDLREFNIRRKNANIDMTDVLRNIEEAPVNAIPPIVNYITEYLWTPAGQYLDWAQSNQCTYVPCKSCGFQFLIPLQPAPYYDSQIRNGINLWLKCQRCGFETFYSPFEILGFLALTLLEKNNTL